MAIINGCLFPTSYFLVYKNYINTIENLENCKKVYRRKEKIMPQH